MKLIIILLLLPLMTQACESDEIEVDSICTAISSLSCSQLKTAYDAGSPLCADLKTKYQADSCCSASGGGYQQVDNGQPSGTVTEQECSDFFDTQAASSSTSFWAYESDQSRIGCTVEVNGMYGETASYNRATVCSGGNCECTASYTCLEPL